MIESYRVERLGISRIRNHNLFYPEGKEMAFVDIVPSTSSFPLGSCKTRERERWKSEIKERDWERIWEREGREIERLCEISRDAFGIVGGILVGWNEAKFNMISNNTGQFSIIVSWMDRVLNKSWTFNIIYGPTKHNVKVFFLERAETMIYLGVKNIILRWYSNFA